MKKNKFLKALLCVSCLLFIINSSVQIVKADVGNNNRYETEEKEPINRTTDSSITPGGILLLVVFLVVTLY